MCAHGEVSSSNKRKVALQILLLLPHTDHHDLPLPRLSATGLLPLSPQPPPLLLPPLLPLPLSLVTAPISRFARANSQIANFPRSSRTVRRWWQSQARLWGLRKRKTWRVGMGEKEENGGLWSRGVNAFDRIALRDEKIHVRRKVVRSKIGCVCHRKLQMRQRK